jgi:PIN domain nuclease of toxin-antitoxin system
VRLLLDTHALLWWLADDRRLQAGARKAIGDVGNEIYVSAASAWEIAIKAGLGKLSAPDDLPEQLTANSFTPLDVSVPHALAVRHLPDHHRDPFDQLLVAQAQLEGLTIITADERITLYNVPVLAGALPG